MPHAFREILFPSYKPHPLVGGAVDKFPNLALEEIEAMLDLDEFINTRLYKSILEKSRLKLVPKLTDKGMSIQEIAELLELDVEIIRKYLQ